MKRGRCQKCLRAGEIIGVSQAGGNGLFIIRRWLCEHCAIHADTPAMGCGQCFPPKDKAIGQ
jgi:hypothetical protein